MHEAAETNHPSEFGRGSINEAKQLQSCGHKLPKSRPNASSLASPTSTPMSENLPSPAHDTQKRYPVTVFPQRPPYTADFASTIKNNGQRPLSSFDAYQSPVQWLLTQLLAANGMHMAIISSCMKSKPRPVVGDNVITWLPLPSRQPSYPSSYRITNEISCLCIFLLTFRLYRMFPAVTDTFRHWTLGNSNCRDTACRFGGM